MTRALFHIAFAAALLAPAVVAGDAVAQTTPQGPPSPLVRFTIVDNTIPEPLTDVPGDPDRGKRVVTNASNSTCLICHKMPIPEQPDQGQIAPPLDGIGNRYTAAQLRLRLVNPKLLTPETMMPAYYRVDGLTRVQAQYQGRTIYSPQDIEDAIVYLLTLK
ncbi:MAG: sulfur oxidation c-type cytochrome SoxX [Alphaproteobacteria bacterium]|nr:sulfur oxidation c-type cytochrome SoxX [Alphaproteobacteria bacterium]